MKYQIHRGRRWLLTCSPYADMITSSLLIISQSLLKLNAFLTNQVPQSSTKLRKSSLDMEFPKNCAQTTDLNIQPHVSNASLKNGTSNTPLLVHISHNPMGLQKEPFSDHILYPTTTSSHYGKLSQKGKVIKSQR